MKITQLCHTLLLLSTKESPRRNCYCRETPIDFGLASREFPFNFISFRPFLTARVQDLGFRKITLWGEKYVNFPRTQKSRTRVLEKWPCFSRTRVPDFWKFQEPGTRAVRNGLTANLYDICRKNQTGRKTAGFGFAALKNESRHPKPGLLKAPLLIFGRFFLVFHPVFVSKNVV